MIDRRQFLSHGSLAASFFLGGGLGKGFTEDSAGGTVQTNAGKVRGLRQGKVNIFKGIPYGASTAGSGRFMPPSKPQPWTGVKDMFELGPKSPQLPERLIPEVAAMRPKNEEMNEDCLRLNVWTAGLGEGKKRPVMFWMHGGGFATGSGGAAYYDGSNLATKQDVVVVTVNHRLNLFGFLYLGDLGSEKYATGNVGMLDIVAALEWVKDNIAAFGGDPGNVTIFGESGGGGKVSTLLAMPAAKGLYHRAIVESASAIRAVPRDAATKSAETILAKLGLKAGQVDEIQKIPVEQLLAAMQGTRGLRLSPVVEGHSLPNHPFDPSAPEVSANVPLIIGSNETEVTFQPATPLEPLDDASLFSHVKQYLRVGDDEAERLIAVYRKARPTLSNIDLYLVMASDSWMRVNVVTEAERKAALGKAPVYMYYLTWRTPVREGKLRTPHTLDIAFVFDNVDIDSVMTGDGKDRYALADRMSGAWAAFARTGNPNHKGLPNWPAYTTSQRATMVFDNECRVVNDPHREERLAMASVKGSAG